MLVYLELPLVLLYFVIPYVIVSHYIWMFARLAYKLVEGVSG